MKMTKRIFSFVVAILMVICTLPTFVIANDTVSEETDVRMKSLFIMAMHMTNMVFGETVQDRAKKLRLSLMTI